MSEPLAARHEEILGEFAEWLHASARETHRRMMAAEDAEAFKGYGDTLHKLGRNLRQTLVLHKRFEVERLSGEAAAERKTQMAAAAPRDWKRARISNALERLVWDEHERDEDYEDGPGERLIEDIEARLSELCDDPDFLETDDEVLIARLCEEFGFEVPPQIVKALAIVAAADTPRPNGHSPDSS